MDVSLEEPWSHVPWRRRPLSLLLLRMMQRTISANDVDKDGDAVVKKKTSLSCNRELKMSSDVAVSNNIVEDLANEIGSDDNRLKVLVETWYIWDVLAIHPSIGSLELADGIRS